MERNFLCWIEKMFILELDLDLGARRKSPFFWISPWPKARLSINPWHLCKSVYCFLPRSGQRCHVYN